MTRKVGIINFFINLLFIGSAGGLCGPRGFGGLGGLGGPSVGFGGFWDLEGPGIWFGALGFELCRGLIRDSIMVRGELGLFMGFWWINCPGGFEGGQVGCLL